MRAWQRLPLGSASRPPQPPFPGASLPLTASPLLAGLRAAGWWPFSRAGLFPPGSPAAHSLVYGPRAALRGLQAGCWEIFIGLSIEMRPSGAPLWEPAFQTGREQRLPGQSGFSAGPALFPLCLAWQSLAGLFRSSPRAGHWRPVGG